MKKYSKLNRGIAGTMALATIASAGLGLITGVSTFAANIDSAHSVGAMKDFKVGDTFKASKNFKTTMLIMDNPAYPYNGKQLFWTSLQKTTGVTIDPTVVPMSDYAQKRQLLISSGSAPTIMPKTYIGEATAFTGSGAILPISDYVKYMPNLQSKIKSQKLTAQFDGTKDVNGKYYVLPKTDIAPQNTIVVRKDIFEKAGVDINDIKTWSDYKDALAKVKASDSSVVPMSDSFATLTSGPSAGGEFLSLVGTGFGTPEMGWNYGDYTQFNKKTKKFVAATSTAGYKKTLEYMSDLMKDGLIDSEVTQTADQAQNKFINGKSAAVSGNTQTIGQLTTKMDAALGSGKYELALLPLLTETSGKYGGVPNSFSSNDGVMLSANIKKSKNFKAILQYLDYLFYSDKGQRYTYFGVKGTTYDKYDKAKNVVTLNKNVAFSVFGTNLDASNKDQKDLRNDFGFANGVFVNANSPYYRAFQSGDAVKWVSENSKKKAADIAPAAPMSSQVQQQANLKLTPAIDYINSETLKFITGANKMSDFDKFAKEAKNKGLTDYLKLKQEAYKTASKK
jgi:putative aldouronate transport system substrate-binding protein